MPTTYLMVAEGTNQTYNHVGVADSFHPISHHANEPERIAKVSKIQTWHMERFANFLQKMASTKDGDGTLFDRAMVTYGGGLGKDHDHDNLPLVLTGRGNGLFNLGRNIKYPNETPLANLHVAMMNQLGVPAEKFADSNGKLGYLSDL